MVYALSLTGRVAIDAGATSICVPSIGGAEAERLDGFDDYAWNNGGLYLTW